MKYLLILVVLGLSGCATAIRSDDMQPDGSYRIISEGPLLAPESNLRDEAFGDASRLCPSGYDTKSETGMREGNKHKYRVIVKCKG